MNTLKNIEERIKFKKYLNNLDSDDRTSIITRCSERTL